MKKQTHLYIIFYLLTYNIAFAQNASRIRFCVYFHPNNISKNIFINWQNENYHINSSDTCFTLANKKRPVGRLVVQGEGYQTFEKNFSLDSLSSNRTININIYERVNLLKEIKIKSNRMFSYKGDTLFIETDSIKTKPFSNATETLNKIPGIIVGENGVISVLGKNLQRITVDGNALFGGNPKATLEIIRSEMIDRLEVNDNISGTVATMNIKLKKDKRKGGYGNLTGGIGNNEINSNQVQYNSIIPNSFFNVFIGNNNTNEKLISEQQDYWLSQNFILNNIDGAYSVADIATASSFKSISQSQANSIPHEFGNEGVNSTQTGGINYSKSTEKLDIYAYAFGSKLKQNLFSSINENTIYSNFKQITNSLRSESNNKFNGWSAINATIKPNKSDTWRISSRFNSQDFSDLLNNSQFINSSSDSIKFEGISLLQRNKKSLQELSLNQQISLTHRFKKPAHIISLYSGYNLTKTLSEDTYSNLLSDRIEVLKNNNLVNQNQNYKNLSAQLIYAHPITKSWLAEVKASITLDKSPLLQNTFAFDSTKKIYNIFRPNLSINPFTTSNNLQNYSLNVLYKSNKLSLRIGSSINLNENQRFVSTDQNINLYQFKILPLIIFKYQPNNNVKLSASFNNNVEQINNNYLLPIPDSSNIQQVRSGSIFLKPMFINQFELSSSYTTEAGNLFSLRFKFEYNNASITPSVSIDSYGLTALNYNYQLPSKQATATLMWYQFSRDKPYNFYFLTLLSYKQSNIIFNREFLKLNNFFSFSSAIFNWNISKFINLKTEARSNIFFQNNNFNYRGNLILKGSYQITDRLYLELYNNTFFSRSISSTPVYYNILNVSLQSFLLKSKRIKSTLAINNLLNIERDYTNSISLNVQSEQYYNRIPRYFLLSLTWYFDKWLTNNK